MTFSNPFDLSSLDGSNGFSVSNNQPDNLRTYVGESVSEAGDINGDGFDDFIVGAFIRPVVEPTPNNPYAYSFSTSTSYVVFGRDEGFSADLDLAQLDGSDGFTLIGSEEFYGAPHFVSDAGDFNGDGIDDIIIGTIGGGFDYDGESYIVFGRQDGFAAELDLNNLDSEEGLTISGGLLDVVLLGNTVDGLGDINGDGLDDVAVNSITSDDYIIFGTQEGSNSDLLLSDLDGTNGFVIAELFNDDIESAGDFNGDGINDFLFVEKSLDNEELFVVFGGVDFNFGSRLDVDELDSSNSVSFTNLEEDIPSTFTTFEDVGVGGDLNSDGIDDLVIATSTRMFSPENSEGEETVVVQVIFGSSDSDQSSFDNGFSLADIDGTNGFAITGFAAEDADSGISINFDSAGDVNGDGIDDLIISAEDLFINGEVVSASYVVFGREGDFQADIDLADLDGNNGFVIPDAFIVSGAGDLNSDDVDDIIVGDGDNSFVIFGEVPDSEPEQIPQLPVLNFASRIFATSGDDEIALGGSGQVAFGQNGDDVIDFRFDSGANRAFGGDGDDTFLLGSGDRIFGVDGNDTFIVGSGGGNVITGNRGDDQYIIADGVIPESVNTITDFVTGDDLLVIQNLGASFEDLSFRDSAEGAIVALNGEDLVVLTNRNANFIGNADNFLFVDPTPETPEFTQVFANDGDNNILATDSNEVFFGLGGDDVIDFRSDTGANRAFGGDGNDIFLLGSGDRIFGVDGNDRFFLSSGGENVITGNRGEDQYIIDGVIPESANTITDFVVGDDLIVIQGLGVGFTDLGFRDSADGAIVSLNGSDLAVLTNRNANFIGNENNFDFLG